MNLSFYTITVVLFITFSIEVQAQKDTIQDRCDHIFNGKVLDGESKEPLIGASIFIEELNRGVFSDIKGEFVFNSLCMGNYTIVCSHFSYKSVKSSLTIKHNVTQNYVLHADTCVFESVILDIEKPITENPQMTYTLEGKELSKTRGLSLGESLKSIPGVYTIQTGPSIFKPVIQGMYGTRVLILNNGIRQEGQQWGNEHAPEIDPFVASKITVIKGASSIRYGSDPIGGVILVDPKELRKEPGLGGEVNLVGFSNNRQGVASGILDFSLHKIKGLSGRLQGTLKRAGNSQAPDYYIKNTGFKEHNFSAALGYGRNSFGLDFFYSQFNTTIGIFSGSHIGNLTDLQRAIDTKVPFETSGFSYKIEEPYQEITHHLFKARSFYKFEKAGKLELVYARQDNLRAEYDKHKPDSPELEFEITTHVANVVYEHEPVKSLRGSIGFNGVTQANVYSGRDFIPNFRSYAGGLFWIEHWKRNKFEIEAGVRYDYKFLEVFKWENNAIINPNYHFNNFSGSGGVIYTPHKAWQFKGNFSTAFRPPAVNELFSDGLHHGSAAIETGDRNLVPEVAYNTTATAAFQYRKMHGEINVFHNYIHDYIFLNPELVTTLTIRGAFPTFKYKQTDAVFYGTDLVFVDSLSKRFVYSLKLSVVRAYNLTAKDYLINIPPTRVENGLKYLFKDHTQWKDSYIGVNHVLVARQKRVPENSDYTNPPPGYMLFNIEMGTSYFLGKQQINLQFSINNLFNQRYRDYLDRFRYYTDAIGRNFIVRMNVPFNISKK